MRSPQILWFLTLTTKNSVASCIAEALEGEALAVTVIAPPRKEMAIVEAIYAHQPELSDVTAKLSILSTVYDFDVPHFKIQRAPNLDWLKKVSEDFPPLPIARWTVHGALHRHRVQNRQYAMQIDATNAFGTGEHPTTRGCLVMLDKLLKKGVRPRHIVDIGCGSGILAMAAIQVTRGQAVAVDLDPDSVQIATRNVRDNGLGPHIYCARSRGYDAPIIAKKAPYDLIMANIFARPLCQMAKDLKKHLRPGGMAILSGLLTSQANMVIAAHRLQGLALIEHIKLGEWSVLALKCPSRA